MSVEWHVQDPLQVPAGGCVNGTATLVNRLDTAVSGGIEARVESGLENVLHVDIVPSSVAASPRNQTEVSVKLCASEVGEEHSGSVILALTGPWSDRAQGSAARVEVRPASE